MIDVHDKLGNTGIMPEVFGLSTYSLLVGLGLVLGILYIVWQNRRAAAAEGSGQNRAGQALVIVAAALCFGTIGAKIPPLLENPTLQTLLFSKSIVGGLLGGTLGVILIKKVLGIKLRLGNIIAPAAALGLTFGRIGCFLNGCCLGIPSRWGVDFGDGIRRLPTQLFEAGFHLTAFFILHFLGRKIRTPGVLFQSYILVYFIFRFFLEFIRVNPIFWQGLTIYQLLSLAGIIWMGLTLWLRRRRTETANVNTDQ